MLQVEIEMEKNKLLERIRELQEKIVVYEQALKRLNEQVYQESK